MSGGAGTEIYGILFYFNFYVQNTQFCITENCGSDSFLEAEPTRNMALPIFDEGSLHCQDCQYFAIFNKKHPVFFKYCIFSQYKYLT